MAHKDINIVTSLVGAGLEREYLLLREFLMSHGHYVVGMHYTNLQAPMVRSNITMFLEVVMPPALNLARENWLVPNCEWWDSKNDQFLPQFTKILCKTKDCYDIWCRKVGAHKCVYTSFEARDIYDPTIPREARCLHIAGKSEHKNTEAVLRAWRTTHLPHIGVLPHLTVVSRNPKFAEQFLPDNPFPDQNVTHIEKATNEEIIQLMNSHMIHVIPSMYEGFGHVIHEALGCGAMVLTTDAPPMNSYEGIWKDGLISVLNANPRALARLYSVAPPSIIEKVRKASNLVWTKPDQVAEQSKQAREAFLRNKEFFRAKLLELVDGRT